MHDPAALSYAANELTQHRAAGDMQKGPIFLTAIILFAAGVSLPARADLVPGGWLQPPRIPDPPPPAAEAAPAPAQPAAAQPEPVLVRPPPPPAEPAMVQPLPSPKLRRPAVQHHPRPAHAAPPSDGKVQF